MQANPKYLCRFMARRKPTNQTTCSLKWSNGEDLANLEMADISNHHFIDQLNQELKAQDTPQLKWQLRV